MFFANEITEKIFFKYNIIFSKFTSIVYIIFLTILVFVLCFFNLQKITILSYLGTFELFCDN